MSILLIILPLYPKTVNDFVYSVSLFSHSDLTPVNRTAYWTVFILLILFGAVKVILNQVKIEKGRNILTNISIVVNIAIVLILAMTKQAYAIVIAFLLLVIKSILLIKNKL